MTRASARRAAAQVAGAARRTTRNDPTARGSDWRGATVATVNGDGTITTTDGIPARRMETYQAPAVGDLIHISRSGAGNWRAEGRVTDSSASNGAWANLPLASGFTTPHGSLGVAQYRLINAYGTPRVELRGSVDASPSVTAQTPFTALLDDAFVPSANRSFAVRCVYSTTTHGTVPVEMSAATGLLTVFGSDSVATTWFALDAGYYDL